MGRTELQTTLHDLAAESSANPFDCIVVGAGSAGLTAARTLVEHRLRIAVLEAGEIPFLTHILNTELRFNRQLSENLRAQTQYSPRLSSGDPFGTNFSCLGGRGVFWNGSSPRFRAHDFEGWPFSLQDLEPYYEWAEREFRVHHGLGRTRLARAIIDSLQNAGFPAEPGPFAADVERNTPGTLSAGVASGLAVFLRGAGEFITNGRLRVACGVRAIRILLSSGVVRGIAAVTRTGDSREVLCRAIVLAGGGIESVRLAAVSSVPDASGRIGAGLQDHIFYRSFCEGPAIYDPAGSEWAVVYIPASGQATEQWEIHAPGRRLFTLDDGTAWAPTAGDAYWLMIRSFASTEKRDDNHVQAKEGDLGSAVIHFSYTDRDRHTMDAMKDTSVRIGRALQLTVKEERIASPGSSYHEAGGLDMGTNPTTSVTNSEGRFHHVANLVCTDAASFPRIGAVNPHLTIVAVSRRQATLLARRLA